MKYQVITEMDGLEPWVEATFDTEAEARDYIDNQYRQGSEAHYYFVTN